MDQVEVFRGQKQIPQLQAGPELPAADWSGAQLHPQEKRYPPDPNSRQHLHRERQGAEDWQYSAHQCHHRQDGQELVCRRVARVLVPRAGQHVLEHPRAGQVGPEWLFVLDEAAAYAHQQVRLVPAGAHYCLADLRDQDVGARGQGILQGHSLASGRI